LHHSSRKSWRQRNHQMLKKKDKTEKWVRERGWWSTCQLKNCFTFSPDDLKLHHKGFSLQQARIPQHKKFLMKNYSFHPPPAPLACSPPLSLSDPRLPTAVVHSGRPFVRPRSSSEFFFIFVFSFNCNNRQQHDLRENQNEMMKVSGTNPRSLAASSFCAHCRYFLFDLISRSDMHTPIRV
jgi:hypothetical protein